VMSSTKVRGGRHGDVSVTLARTQKLEIVTITPATSSTWRHGWRPPAARDRESEVEDLVDVRGESTIGGIDEVTRSITGE